MSKQIKTDNVVRAIDLGWGWTKYSVLNAKTGEISFNAFPSLAPRHTSADLSLSVFGRRETAVVWVDGTEYEVGPDSADLDANDTSRNLNDQYIYSDQYKAVLYGALHYIGEPEIDLLVVGLPLSGMRNAEKLTQLITGQHDLNDLESVTVKKVMVLPQPAGALFKCLDDKTNPDFENLREETNLIIDPGFLTFDFLLTQGDKIVENRSDSHTGGVSKVLRALAESISIKHGVHYENLGAIDKALRTGKFKINGAVERLDDHMRSATPAIEASVTFMKNVVGDGSDIDNILLSGGGAHLYKEALNRHYKNHKIIELTNGRFANVEGFQGIGILSVK